MCCTRLGENTGPKKSPKIRHLGTIAQLCRAVSSQLRHISTIGKNLLNINISYTCSYNMVNLRLRSIGEFGAPQQISTGFASWLRYCTDIARRRSTKLSMMFGRLLSWYTIYTFSGVLPSNGILPRGTCKIDFASKSCVLLYLQGYCTAFEQ